MNPRTPLERKMRNEVRRLREEEERRALSSMRQGYAYGKRGTLDRMDDYRDQLVDRAGKLLARQTSKVAREMPGPKAHGMREFSRDMIKLLRDERARERAHVSREIDHANREDYRRAKEGMEYNQRKDEAQIVKLTRTVAGTRKSILDELQESLAQLDDLAKGRKRVNTSPFFAVQERGKRQANGISSQGKGDGTARDPIRPSGKNDDANRPAHTFVTQREKQHTDKSFSMDDAYEAMVPWFFGGPTAPRDPGLRQPFQKSTKPNINELVAFNQRTYGFTRLDTLKRLAKSHGFSPESFMFDDLLIKAVPADATAAFGGEKAREKAPPPPPPPNPKDPNVARLESVADRAAGTPTVTPPPPKPASAAAPLPAEPAITGGGTRTQRQTTGMLPHVAAAAAFKEVDPLSDQGHQIMLAHSQSRGWGHGLDETGRMGINTQIGAREAAHGLASLAAAGIVGSYKSPHELEFDNDDHKAEWMASHGLSDASTANIIKTGFEDKGKHIIMVNVHGASGKPEQMMMTFDRNAGGWVPAGGVDAYGRVHNSGDETHEYAKRVGNMLNHYVGDADKFTDQNTLVVNSANARVRNSLHGNMDKNFANAWSKINTVNNIGQNQADQWHDAAMNRYLAAMNSGKGRMSSPISLPGTAAAQTTAAPVVTPDAAPVAASEAAPVAASEAAPVAASEAAPVAASEAASEAAPEAASEAAPVVTPDVAPEVTAESYRAAKGIEKADKDHINKLIDEILAKHPNDSRKNILEHIINNSAEMAETNWKKVALQDKDIANNEQLKQQWIQLHAAEYKKNAQELLDQENNVSAPPGADATTDPAADATVTPPDPAALLTDDHKSTLSDLAQKRAYNVLHKPLQYGKPEVEYNKATPSSIKRMLLDKGARKDFLRYINGTDIPDTDEAFRTFQDMTGDHYEKAYNDRFPQSSEYSPSVFSMRDSDVHGFRQRVEKNGIEEAAQSTKIPLDVAQAIYHFNISQPSQTHVEVVKMLQDPNLKDAIDKGRFPDNSSDLDKYTKEKYGINYSTLYDLVHTPGDHLGKKEKDINTLRARDSGESEAAPTPTAADAAGGDTPKPEATYDNILKDRSRYGLKIQELAEKYGIPEGKITGSLRFKMDPKDLSQAHLLHMEVVHNLDRGQDSDQVAKNLGISVENLNKLYRLAQRNDHEGLRNLDIDAMRREYAARETSDPTLQQLNGNVTENDKTVVPSVESAVRTIDAAKPEESEFTDSHKQEMQTSDYGPASQAQSLAEIATGGNKTSAEQATAHAEQIHNMSADDVDTLDENHPVSEALRNFFELHHDVPNTEASRKHFFNEYQKEIRNQFGYQEPQTTAPSPAGEDAEDAAAAARRMKPGEGGTEAITALANTLQTVPPPAADDEAPKPKAIAEDGEGDVGPSVRRVSPPRPVGGAAVDSSGDDVESGDAVTPDLLARIAYYYKVGPEDLTPAHILLDKFWEGDWNKHAIVPDGAEEEHANKLGLSYDDFMKLHQMASRGENLKNIDLDAMRRAHADRKIDPSTFTTKEEFEQYRNKLTTQLMDRATPEEERALIRDKIQTVNRLQKQRFAPTIDAGAAEAAATDARIEAQVTRNPQAIKAADELGRVAESIAELSGVVPEAVKNRRQQIEDMADSFAASPEAQAAHKKLLQDIDKGTLSSLQSITRRLNAIAKQHGVTIPFAPVVRRRDSSTADPAPVAAAPVAAASGTTEERGDDSETPFPDYASKQISLLKNEIGDHPRASAGLQNLIDDIQDGSVSTREALQARIEKIKTDVRPAAGPLQELSSAAEKLESTTRPPENQEYRIEDAPLSPSIRDKFKSLLENPNTAWRVTPPQGRFVNRNGNATSPYTKVESDGGKTRVTLGKIGMKATDAILAALEKQGGLHTQVQQQTHGNTTSFVFPMDKKQTLNFITRTLAAKSRQTGDPISLEHTLSENIYDEDAPIAAGLSGDQAPAPTAAPAPTEAPAAETAPAEAQELPDDQKRNVEDILDTALTKASDQEMAGETKSQVLPLLLKYITDSDDASLNEAVKIWQQHHSSAFPLMGQVRKLNQIKENFNAKKSFASIAQMSLKKSQRLQNEEIAILMNRMYGYGVKQSLSKMRSVF